MTVKFYGSVQKHFSGDKLFHAESADSDLSGLIDLLGERYGQPSKDFLYGENACLFLVNGSGIMSTGGLKTPLRAGDTVEILPFVDAG